MSKPSRARYRTTNCPAYNASLKRRGSLMVRLDPKLQWQAAPSGRAGWPEVFSDAAIQFCLTKKCMSGLGLRQAAGLAKSLLKLTQIDWNVPNCSTLSRRQKTLRVARTFNFQQRKLASVVLTVLNASTISCAAGDKPGSVRHQTPSGRSVFANSNGRILMSPVRVSISARC